MKYEKTGRWIEVTTDLTGIEDTITVKICATPPYFYSGRVLDALQNLINEIREEEKTDEEHEKAFIAERREELEDEGRDEEEIDGIIEEELNGEDE